MAQIDLDVQRRTGNAERRLVDRLGQRRVGVHRGHQIVGRELGCPGQDQLVDQLGGIGAHELAAVSGLLPPEGASLLGALIGFVSVLRWLQGYSARLAADPRYRAVLLRRDDGRGAAVQWS